MDEGTTCLCNNLVVLLKQKLEELSDAKREVKEVDKLPYSIERLYNENNKRVMENPNDYRDGWYDMEYDIE